MNTSGLRYLRHVMLYRSKEDSVAVGQLWAQMHHKCHLSLSAQVMGPLKWKRKTAALRVPPSYWVRFPGDHCHPAASHSNSWPEFQGFPCLCPSPEKTLTSVPTTACQTGVIICALREAPVEYILRSEAIVANLRSFSLKNKITRTHMPDKLNCRACTLHKKIHKMDISFLSLCLFLLNIIESNYVRFNHSPQSALSSPSRPGWQPMTQR